MTTVQPGERVSEYVLDSVVGAGSFGQVWKARHHIWTDQVVAIKIPTDSQYVRNLQREGVAIHGLKHQNIVRAIGLDPYAEAPYLVMEFVDGCSLRQLIERNAKGTSVRAVQKIMIGLLRALDHAHGAGIVHRDIKPENILVAGGDRKAAEELSIDDVKVTDFGLGKAGQVTTASIMQSGSMLAEDGKSISGTLAYMAPEQREGGATDARTDLYAAGIVLFEMIVGERPSGSDLPSHVREGLPSWVDAVFSRMYTRLERRFASAVEALKTIEESTVPPIIAARAYAGPVPPPLKPTDRNPRAWGAVRKCPSCGAALGPFDNYCTTCGDQIVADVRRCASCGAYPDQDDRFCISCGSALPAGTT